MTARIHLNVAQIRFQTIIAVIPCQKTRLLAMLQFLRPGYAALFKVLLDHLLVPLPTLIASHHDMSDAYE